MQTQAQQDQHRSALAINQQRDDENNRHRDQNQIGEDRQAVLVLGERLGDQMRQLREADFARRAEIKFGRRVHETIQGQHHGQPPPTMPQRRNFW